jgi:hypothetical protein
VIAIFVQHLCLKGALLLTQKAMKMSSGSELKKAVADNFASTYD